MKGLAVVFMVALAVAVAATPTEAITCGDIQGSLYPCLAYLTGGGEPSEQCCGGVRSLSGRIRSRQDRQTACYCVKSASSSFGVRPDSASNLPGKCGVSIGMTVTPNIDCSQVS